VQLIKDSGASNSYALSPNFGTTQRTGNPVIPRKAIRVAAILKRDCPLGAGFVTLMNEMHSSVTITQ
jgi:hypothetical protein